MEPDWTVHQFITGSFLNGKKLAIWGRGCSFPDLHQQKQQTHSHCQINTSSPSSHRTFLICKTWQLGANLVYFLTLGQIWKSLPPFLSYQFDAFFSYFYTLKHKNFHRIQNTDAEHAFTNRKCMKMGYSFRPTETILTQERKVWKQEAKCIKIASVGLKLDRPQLQHWLLFLEHNWPAPKSENSNVVGLPVPPVCPLPATYCKPCLSESFKNVPFI